MKSCFRLGLVATLWFVVAGTVIAEPSRVEKKPNSKTNDAAIRDVFKSLATAFNKGDTKTLTTFWTEDADLVNVEGKKTVGRDALIRQFEQYLFAGTAAQIHLNITAVRMLSPRHAIVDADIMLAPPPAGPPTTDRITAVVAKQGKKWQIASLREAVTQQPSNYPHLKHLEWLIGNWTGRAEDNAEVEIISTCEWTVNKNFILRAFAIKIRGETKRVGTQVIGWDPLAAQVTSWTFDSEAGVFTGRWSRDDNRWTIKETGALRDGEKVSATNTMSRIDPDTYELASRERLLDGAAQPNIEKVLIKRAIPAADKVTPEADKVSTPTGKQAPQPSK